MKIQNFGRLRGRRYVWLAVGMSIASPAFADHVGPSSFGAGGGISVFAPYTLDAGQWAAGLRLTYTRPEQRSDAQLAALAAQHVHAHNSDYNLNASAGVAFGINHHLTLSGELPYVRRDSLREGTHAHSGGVASNGVEQLGSVSGIGDANILAKYRLTDDERFGFAIIGGIKLPTGSTHRRSLDGERLETEHQPATGSWDPIFGASGSANLGTVQLAVSGLYQLSTRGAQRSRLGDRFQGGLALSRRFGGAIHAPHPSVNHHHGDELDEHHDAARSSWDAFVEVGGEWEGRQKVSDAIEAESGGSWAYLAPGLRYNAAAGWSAGAALALPVWQHIRASHPDNRYRLTLSFGKAF